jgi:hypothetical protein
MHHLQGHRPTASREGQVNLPHPARTEPGPQPVPGYLTRIATSQRFQTQPASLPRDMGHSGRIHYPRRRRYSGPLRWPHAAITPQHWS